MVKPTRYTQEIYDEYFSKGYWTNETTSEIWDQNAAQFPDREAFVDARCRLTWSQVKLMSDRLAFNLLGLGLKRDEFLFSLLPNCVESYIIRGACEKAGVICGSALMTIREMEIGYVLKQFAAVGIAIPLEFRKFPFYKAVCEMRSDLPGLRHVFVMGGKVPDGALPLETMMHQPDSVPSGYFDLTRIGAIEVSMIGFTSGTTGMPKGAEHAQCSRIAMAKGYGAGPRIHGNDIVLNIISPVGGLSSAFTYNGSAALVGATVVLLEIWSPEKTFALIEKERATILLAVPAQLAKIVLSPSLDNYDLSSLRCVCTSTAPLPYSLAKEVEERLKVPVVNFYGQFDAGSIAAVSIDDPPEIRRSTVGKPLKENCIALLGEDGKEVGPGEIGEVVYTGPTAGSGYYGDLETTLKVWGTLGKDGRCRSGDLAKFDQDGNLILVGRKKEVIIRGGQNVYPAEVEGLLLTHPKINSVAIVPMPDPIMGEKCCAYVVLKQGEELSFEEMAAFLKGRKIANYKIPERLEVRGELPLKGHQKIAKEPLRQDIIERLREEGKLSMG